MRRFGILGVYLLAMLGYILCIAQPAHAQIPTRKGPSITVNPTSGPPGTQVQVTGVNYNTFCAGYILIDGNNTGTMFTCGSSNSFTATITWPDNLPDGHYTVTARSVFTDASTGFVQTALVQPTVTPEPTVTPNATTAAGAGSAGTTPPTSSSGPYTSNLPAVLAFAGLCCSVLVLGFGVVMLFLSLRRRDARQAAAYPAAYAAPPPPPPPDAPLNPDDPWIWPRDPSARP